MTVTYTSLDGTRFDSEKKCKEHDSLPHGFLVNSEYSFSPKVFANEKIAIKCADSLNHKNSFIHHRVTRIIVDVSESVKTIHSAVTNNAEPTKTFWDCFKRCSND